MQIQNESYPLTIRSQVTASMIYIVRCGLFTCLRQYWEFPKKDQSECASHVKDCCGELDKVWRENSERQRYGLSGNRVLARC